MHRVVILLALALFSTTVEAGTIRYSGGVTGPAAWIIGAPLYWFIARYYLSKPFHLAAAAGAILLLLVITGPIGLASGLIGVAAAYWIYWPFTQSEKIKNKSAALGGVMLVNVFATIAAAIFLVEPVAAALPKW